MAQAIKPVSLTAYFTCGVRAEDARRPRPVVGDRHAERFMTPEGWALREHMRDLRRPSLSILARHRLIDDRVRAELAAAPDLLVALVGAGFDSRAYRLAGGRWLEVDEPALIERKEAILPAASAPNPLTRLAVDFGAESLAERLAPHAGAARAIAILEGVLLYLDAAQQAATARALACLAPRLTVLCDVMSPTFFRRAGALSHERLAACAAPFKVQHVEVERLWAREGYRVIARHSIPAAMHRHRLAHAPPWLLATLMRWVRDGYQVLELARG